METFIARQPVFDREMNTVAYSLYYRHSYDNYSTKKDDTATASVILNGPLAQGYNALTDGQPAIIKMTGNVLMEDMVSLLNPDKTYVELIETVESEEVLSAIARVREQGYTTVATNEILDRSHEDLKNHIDIVSIDFSTSGLDEIRKLLLLEKEKHIKLMAIKVETREQFVFAKTMHFSFFQGHFINRPSIVATKSMKTFKNAYFTLMNELQKEHPDFRKIGKDIESDLTLTYKLLQLVNTLAFGATQQVSDIHQAVVRIGSKQLQKWISLVIVNEACHGKPPIYAKTSLIRAKAMENLGENKMLSDMKEDLFMTGMFSMIDVVLERPMEEILSELPLRDNVVSALWGGNCVLGRILKFMKAYEDLDWKGMEEHSLTDMGLAYNEVIISYLKAIDWSANLFDAKLLEQQ